MIDSLWQDDIPIVEAARRCGIRIPPEREGRTEILVHCPFCQAKKDHLYLNTVRNVFYCQDCHASGNSLTLYARLAGCSPREAFRELSGLRTTPRSQRPSTPLAPLATRHAAYYDMLGLMGLSHRHRTALLERGFSAQRVEENLYRSVPAQTERDRIAETLSKAHDLRGVPGFYTWEGRWRLTGVPGILIPVCNPEGYIQGLQIRRDNAARNKYGWLSSNPEYGYENGTGARRWIHVTGNPHKRVVCITEGALKGDTAVFLREDAPLFLCVPGVGALELLGDACREAGVRKAVICYDTDLLRNPEVLQSLCKLRALLWEQGIPSSAAHWNPAYKGIDDFWLAGSGKNKSGVLLQAAA